MAEPLAPGATIGIMGGGQLGRMLAIAAARLGYRAHVFTPEAGAPASLVAAETTVAAYDDRAALAHFAAGVDVVTFEFENVGLDAFDVVEALVPIRPSRTVLATAQDRILEKSFLNSIGVPTAPWMPIRTPADAEAALAAVGLPAVLKTARFGYDGKGQAVVREEAEIAPALAQLAPPDHPFPTLIAEGFVAFAREVSVIVARDAAGNRAAFDVVENRHVGGILDLSIAPARVDAGTAAAARDAAFAIAEAFALEGLICIEFFVIGPGEVLANEIAPRPHNSGHWTIEACAVSQFEQQVRAISGLPLGDPARHSDALMKNLIGAEIEALPALLATPGLIPHHYGKTAIRAGRKMGHVTRLYPRGELPDEGGIAAAFRPALG
ncbi:5-(carboxyamino)imidazole ribonucleotide synthase [Elioraea tepidiphila]|jgi:5-(carboxyamino)imidazole ribonucleotide synthase|uniref:5-(carboxyamino)imidazole ribonucleotide synthase n=1 Tax=Elioraea tepidiphila TaxID=457934 RepID=UPI002FDA4C9B